MKYNDLLLPLSIIVGALLLGVLVERLVIRSLARLFEKRGWRIVRGLLNSLNGIVTIWFGVAAFRSVLSDLPLKASVVPIVQDAISAILIITIAVLLARMAVGVVRLYSRGQEHALPSLSLITNLTRTTIYVLGLLAILRAFGVAVTPLITALGVGGLAVALALQDTLSNLFAGIYIVLSKNIDPGDYVKLESGQEGKVRDISWRATTLETISNTLIIVPNTKFAASILTNFDRPAKAMYLLIELPIDKDTDVKSFEQAALTAAADAHTARPDIIKDGASLEYTSMTPTGATLTLSVELADFAHQNDVRSELLKRILHSTQ